MQSFISQQLISPGEEIPVGEIRAGIFTLLQKDYPAISSNDLISLDELNRYWRLYLTSLIVQEKGEIAAIDRDVMDAIKNNSILSENKFN